MPIHRKGYFNGEKDGIYMVKYFSSKRKLDHNSELCKKVVNMTFGKKNENRYGISKSSIKYHEKELLAMEYKTAYTIARAYGINITFAKSGYEYGGMLINNTQIAGGIESMNVWYKSLT